MQLLLLWVLRLRNSCGSRVQGVVLARVFGVFGILRRSNLGLVVALWPVTAAAHDTPDSGTCLDCAWIVWFAMTQHLKRSPTHKQHFAD
jgi:hypothetical protein